MFGLDKISNYFKLKVKNKNKEKENEKINYLYHSLSLITDGS